MKAFMRPFRIATAAGLGIVIATGCSRDEPAQRPHPVASAAPAAAAAVPAAAAAANRVATGVKVLASADEDSGESPLTVHLESKVREGSGTQPYSYLWDFGDGTPFGDTSAVTHVYKIPGTYRASIIVTDAKGGTDQDYVDVEVEVEDENPDGDRPQSAPLSPKDALEIFQRAQKAAEAARGVQR